MEVVGDDLSRDRREVGPTLDEHALTEVVKRAQSTLAIVYMSSLWNGSTVAPYTYIASMLIWNLASHAANLGSAFATAAQAS